MTGRLIEADKLKVIEYTDEAETAISKDQAFNRGCQAVFRLIRSAPTVDAIPVEWIKNYINKTNDTNGYAVADMLSDWEAEHDKAD